MELKPISVADLRKAGLEWKDFPPGFGDYYGPIYEVSDISTAQDIIAIYGDELPRGVYVYRRNGKYGFCAKTYIGNYIYDTSLTDIEKGEIELANIGILVHGLEADTTSDMIDDWIDNVKIPYVYIR